MNHSVGRNDPCPCGSGKKFKKCHLMLQERKIHETLKKFFGEEWIEKELGKVRLDGYKNLNPMNLARMDIHPLIKATVGTQIKLQRAKQNGKTPVALGRDELLQILLHKNLTELDQVLDVADLQTRLRNKDEFPKVEYEIAIAAGYGRMGYKPIPIERSAQKRTGEFYVSDTSSKPVLIECKKKDMTSPKEQKITSWWDEFQHLMTQKLEMKQKSYGVAVYIPTDADRQDTHELVDKIIDLINSSCQGEIGLLNDKYKFRFEELKSLEQHERFSSDAPLGTSKISYSKKTGEISELVKINGYFPSDFIEEKVNSIISTLGDAYGQLEDDKPNIVYVDINIASMMPNRSRQVMIKLLPEVTKKLGRDFSKISAVVFTNLKLLGHGEIMGFHADEHVILNENANNKLPDGFRIYGDIRNGQSILADINALVES